MSSSTDQSVSEQPSGSFLTKPTTKKRRWQSTVYDSVASRVNYEGLIKPAFLNEYQELRVRSGKAMPADEVLGRRKRAPGEIYTVSEVVGLPETDLLVAIHQYASDYLHLNGQGDINYRSLDESALLAVGMLLEETVSDLLGETGHLTLVDSSIFGQTSQEQARRVAEGPSEEHEMSDEDE